MVVKNRLKFIKSLQQKKYRTRHGLFVAEGVKLVNELLNSTLSAVQIFTTEEDILETNAEDVHKITEAELTRMSGLKSPNKVLGLFEIPESQSLDYSDWIVALDQVQDPGNLGTIIRLCDWFGIKHLICSPNTADCYSPKTLQATMGSIARVNIVYEAIQEVATKGSLPLYGTFMKGISIYDHRFKDPGILLVGNEAQGISENLKPYINHSLTIPRYGKSEVESLNVATATAVILSEIRRGATQK